MVKFIIGIIIAAILIFVVYKYNKARSGDADKSSLIDDVVAAAKKSGADVFDGVSKEKYTEMLSRLYVSELEKLKELMAMKEKDMNSAQKRDLIFLLEKAAGKKIKS